MGDDHARTLRHSVGGATLSAVYDTDQQRATAVAHDLGAEVLTSDEELIACPKVDAVIIASHDSVHADQVLKCIKVASRCSVRSHSRPRSKTARTSWPRSGAAAWGNWSRLASCGASIRGSPQ